MKKGIIDLKKKKTKKCGQTCNYAYIFQQRFVAGSILKIAKLLPCLQQNVCNYLMQY